MIETRAVVRLRKGQYVPTRARDALHFLKSAGRIPDPQQQEMREGDVEAAVCIRKRERVAAAQDRRRQMQPRLQQRLRLQVQAMQSGGAKSPSARFLRGITENHTGAAAYLKDALGARDAGFFQEIVAQRARPSCLLEVAAVPVHTVSAGVGHVQGGSRCGHAKNTMPATGAPKPASTVAGTRWLPSNWI